MAYFETIKVVDGTVFNADYHVERARRTQEAVYGYATFSEAAWTPLKFPLGLYRLRIEYAEEIQNVAFFPYTLQEHRILSLQDAGDFTYAHKDTDRKYFDDALQRNDDHQDSLFHRKGQILDTSIANLALSDGVQWYTPETYLLPGTKRAYLLDQGILQERDIQIMDLPKYTCMAFINAMRDFEKVYHFKVIQDKIHLKLLP